VVECFGNVFWRAEPVWLLEVEEEEEEEEE
jgi:hypothetical protein